MSSFERHLRIGVLTHIAVVLPVLYFSLLSAETTGAVVLCWLASIPATLIGSVAPDADHHASHAYRLLLRWGPVWVGTSIGGAITMLALEGRLEFPVTGPAFPMGYGVGVATGFTIAGSIYLTRKVIPLLRPPHRGAFHSIPAACGLAIVGGAYMHGLGTAVRLVLADVVSLSWGVGLWIGYMSHLWEDDVLAAGTES